MDLYVLRHAIAEERDSSSFPDDSTRPLTKKGIKRMEEVAQGMLALGLSFDVIYTSPFTRAKQTADIVVKAFHLEDKLRETETLATYGEPAELIKLIKGTKDATSVLIVGHEPYLSDLISTLLAGDTSLSITMKKGGLCKLNVGTLRFGACASLEWLLPPSVSTHLQ